MHDHPAIAELAKTQQLLRNTEDQLGQERARTADLGKQLAAEQQRTEALREQLARIEQTRHLSGRPLVPEQTAGECDATWLPAKPSNGEPGWVTAAHDDRTITDIPTGGLL